MLLRPKKSAKYDVVGVGYNSVDHLCILPGYPEYGTKTAMLDYSIQGGGQTATACAALGKLGFTASYIGKFGSVPSGRLAEESLHDWNVSTTRCLRTDACPNQIAVIWIDGATGERTITYTRGDALNIAPGEIDREGISEGRLLILDAHNIPAMIEVATWAKEAQIPTVLDAERILPGIEKLLELTDYVITDQFFPERMTGISDLREALTVMAKGKDFIAATKGSTGSIALVEGEFIETSAIPIQAVDSTGAGDVFHAGFAAGLLMDFSIEESLQFANVTAGLKCRKLGGRDGIPTREFALSIMEKHFGLPNEIH